jgi:hypothetical protein
VIGLLEAEERARGLLALPERQRWARVVGDGAPLARLRTPPPRPGSFGVDVRHDVARVALHEHAHRLAVEELGLTVKAVELERGEAGARGRVAYADPPGGSERQRRWRSLLVAVAGPTAERLAAAGRVEPGLGAALAEALLERADAFALQHDDGVTQEPDGALAARHADALTRTWRGGHAGRDRIAALLAVGVEEVALLLEARWEELIESANAAAAEQRSFVA